MAAVNGDIMIRSVILQASFTTFMFLGAGLGDVTLAANQVLLQFLAITAYALDGFAFAAEALVGQAVGAAPPRRPAPRRDRRVAVGASAARSLLALAFFAVGPALIDLMATAPDVRAEARELPALDGRGAADRGRAPGCSTASSSARPAPRELRNAMLIAVAIYAAALAVLLPAFGNHGLWAALMILNLARTVTLALRYPALEASARS